MPDCAYRLAGWLAGYSTKATRILLCHTGFLAAFFWYSYALKYKSFAHQLCVWIELNWIGMIPFGFSFPLSILLFLYYWFFHISNGIIIIIKTRSRYFQLEFQEIIVIEEIKRNLMRFIILFHIFKYNYTFGCEIEKVDLTHLLNQWYFEYENMKICKQTKASVHCRKNLIYLNYIYFAVIIIIVVVHLNFSKKWVQFSRKRFI